VQPWASSSGCQGTVIEQVAHASPPVPTLRVRASVHCIAGVHHPLARSCMTATPTGIMPAVHCPVGADGFQVLLVNEFRVWFCGPSARVPIAGKTSSRCTGPSWTSYLGETPSLTVTTLMESRGLPVPVWLARVTVEVAVVGPGLGRPVTARVPAGLSPGARALSVAALLDTFEPLLAAAVACSPPRCWATRRWCIPWAATASVIGSDVFVSCVTWTSKSPSVS
jgi:hypothetical protein